MIIKEPEVVTTGRYPVSKASQILEINRKTLYRHTEEGLIKCGIRRTNGRRFYTGNEILRYWKARF